MVEQEINKAITRRRIYIIFYTMLALILNERSFFSEIKESYNKDKVNLNIISLGYLTMLFYDLTINMDQLLLRLLIKLKYLGNLVNEVGFNNILSFNWFERLRVPYLLRCYFILKMSYFTLNFIFFNSYYFKLDQIIESKNKGNDNSMFDYIQSLFKTPETNNYGSLIKMYDNLKIKYKKLYNIIF